MRNEDKPPATPPLLRYIPVLLAFFLGVTMSAVLFILVREWEQERFNEVFGVGDRKFIDLFGPVGESSDSFFGSITGYRNVASSGFSSNSQFAGYSAQRATTFASRFG